MFVFPIYGMEVYSRIDLGKFQIVPRPFDRTEIKRRARDRKHMYLTAYLQSDHAPDTDFLYDLGGVLTFVQQQYVEICTGVELEANSDRAQESLFDEEYSHDITRESTGRLIREESLQTAINLCLDRLGDPEFEQRTGFRVAFFRHIETWRLRTSYMDITYYLDFSAIEMLSRNVSRDFENRNVSAVVAPFLGGLGFQMTQENPSDLRTSFKTYATLRNGLFHNGELEAKLLGNGPPQVLKLTDYEDEFRMLVPLVILKVIDFDDGHMNWNSWLDRQPFC